VCTQSSGLNEHFRPRGGRVTTAPGTLLRGSDAPERPQFFFAFRNSHSARHVGLGGWVAPRFAREYRAAQQRPAHTKSRRVSVVPLHVGSHRARTIQFKSGPGPGSHRFPFPCVFIGLSVPGASAHRGAQGAV
jgi:hypothetical protein